MSDNPNHLPWTWEYRANRGCVIFDCRGKEVASTSKEKRAEHIVESANAEARIAELEAENKSLAAKVRGQEKQIADEVRKKQLADKLLGAHVAEIEEELINSWWYVLNRESVHKGDGWLCPHISEGEHAGPRLVEAGVAEKHPDHDWYRAIPTPEDEHRSK